MDQRIGFIVACREGEESVAALCRHFGISRKTGHKWWARYRAEGACGLEDRPRAPHSNPRALADDVVAALLAVRQRHPSWGSRKVKAWLEDRAPERSWPAASTIGLVFDRAGLSRPRQRRRRVAPQSMPLAACSAPNDVWCADFKGWFLTGDRTQVEPFTLSDGSSRFLFRCEAVGRTDETHVWPILTAAFCEYGLPRVLRSDNGPPFASLAAAGLSRLAVKLLKAGVLPERIAPGKPQQNGRHERLHLTLKQDTACPPARSLPSRSRASSASVRCTTPSGPTKPSARCRRRGSTSPRRAASTACCARPTTPTGSRSGASATAAPSSGTARRSSSAKCWSASRSACSRLPTTSGWSNTALSSSAP